MNDVVDVSVSSDFKSLRERIIQVLLDAERPLSVEEICRALGLPRGSEREVYEHLAHVAKTVRRIYGGRMALLMEPPACKGCGFIFKDLEKPKRPSKCPRCKSERIEPPRFMIGLA